MILNPPFMISGRLLPALKINDSTLSLDPSKTRFYLDTPEMSVSIKDFIPGLGMKLQDCFVCLLDFMAYAADIMNGEASDGSDPFNQDVMLWCQQNADGINDVKYELEDNEDLIQ